MKQVLSFYLPESCDNTVTLTEKTHGKVFSELSSSTDRLLRDWVVKAISDFVYIRNVNTPEYEKGLAKNNKFKRKVESYLSNLGKNDGERIEYDFLPSEYMDITYTVPIEDDSIIKIEIKGFKGDDGKLDIENREFSVYVSRKNIGKKSFVSYHDENIDIRKKLTTEEDINIFKNIYEYAYILSLSEFIYRRAESYIEHMTKNLTNIKNIQKERLLLLEKYGLKARGVENED